MTLSVIKAFKYSNGSVASRELQCCLYNMWRKNGHLIGKRQNVHSVHVIDDRFIWCIRNVQKVNFTFMWPCIVTNLFTIKPTDALIFPNLFWYETLHVSASSSAHHQELSTVHSALAHVIQVWRQLACRIRMVPSCHCQCRMNSW